MAPNPARELEICVDTPEALTIAMEVGADRIELCAALKLDGLTPGPGLVHLAREVPVPVMAMIRPRAGNFVFGPADMLAALEDIAHMRAAGLAGVVLGASLPDGRLDTGALARMVQAAEGMDLTLHRAFDITPDPFAALEDAIALGFSRILTSGQARSAIEGVGTLTQLVNTARGRIGIMAGAGVRADHAVLLLETGATALHGSFRGRNGLPDREEVARVRVALSRAGGP